MSAQEYTYTQSPEFPGGCLVVLVVIAVAIVGFIFLPLVFKDGTKVKETEHAVKAHGAEAQEIRDCLENKGPESTWKFRPGKKEDYYAFCVQLDDGRWGTQIAQNAKNGWREKTAFVIKDGNWKQVVEYLSARAIEILSE